MYSPLVHTKYKKFPNSPPPIRHMGKPSPKPPSPNEHVKWAKNLIAETKGMGHGSPNLKV